jgi:hypothetical protein
VRLSHDPASDELAAVRRFRGKVSLSSSFASSVARRAAAAMGVLMISGGSVTDIQEPKYVLQEGDFEVRQYGARLVAETTVAGEWSEAGDEGFRRLAGYIFGKNRRGAKIAMTAPVAQHREGDAWTVAFTMPAGETLATLPVPEDSRISLRELPPSRVAVVRFSGRWTDASMKEHEADLRRWASEKQLRVVGEAEVNRYDPPYKPWFLRRNEVWCQLGDVDGQTDRHPR